MYSVIVDDKVLDFKYKKLDELISAFYVGDIYVGQIFKMRRAWSCVASRSVYINGSNIYPVDGFKTRLDASQFLLKAGGFLK